MTVTVVAHACCSATINTQTLTSPLTYQITYSNTFSTILSFIMHSDSASSAANNPMFCGTKAYATDQTWLTVTTPADPVTQQFQLNVGTNDYTLAATY